MVTFPSATCWRSWELVEEEVECRSPSTRAWSGGRSFSGTGRRSSSSRIGGCAQRPGNDFRVPTRASPVGRHSENARDPALSRCGSHDSRVLPEVLHVLVHVVEEIGCEVEAPRFARSRNPAAARHGRRCSDVGIDDMVQMPVAQAARPHRKLPIPTPCPTLPRPLSATTHRSTQGTSVRIGSPGSTIRSPTHTATPTVTALPTSFPARVPFLVEHPLCSWVQSAWGSFLETLGVIDPRQDDPTSSFASRFQIAGGDGIPMVEPAPSALGWRHEPSRARAGLQSSRSRRDGPRTCRCPVGRPRRQVTRSADRVDVLRPGSHADDAGELR